MEAIVNAIIIVVAEENTLINTTTMAINIIKEVIKVVLDSSVQKVSLAQVVSSVVKHV
ncbi:hypothetical protein [Ureibacillus endophyticus]|uniref:hypothetical protein n=1 Tax=Ureibacillus endophyticus TaxID=1978490 RepID=UPI001B872AD4|nr:hypothetical protein [Lysinibacillus endophyticus]